MSHGATLFSAFNEIAKLPPENIGKVGDELPIPVFSRTDFVKLCDLMQIQLRNQTSLIELTGKFVIVGDIHGNLHDLLRIFAKFGYPPDQKYIFLGDYVDRGSFSVECLALLFSLACAFPENMYLLRGNHEFSKINKLYGLHQSVMQKYNDNDVFEKINEVFNFLPIACVLNKQYFLVHAGISVSTKCALECIRKLERPIIEWNDFLADLVWSDPTSSDILGGSPNERGMGTLFSEKDVNVFLKSNNLKAVIRGHQCVHGVHVQHKGQTITLFSSSGYADNNDASAVLLDENGVDEVYTFSPIPHPISEFAFFYEPKRESPKAVLTSFDDILVPKIRINRSKSILYRNKHLHFNSLGAGVGKSVSMIMSGRFDVRKFEQPK